MSKEENEVLEDQEWIEADIGAEEAVEEEAPKKGLVWGRKDGTGKLVRVSVDE